MPTGRVIKMYNGFYYVQQEGSSIREELLSCRLRGRIKRYKGSVVTGDMVAYQLLGDGTGVIEACQPRRNMLKRPAVANIDQVILTFAAKEPDIHPLLLNRLLVLAERSDIPEIVICVNKVDLFTEAQREGFLEAYRRAGYRVLLVSARMGSGLGELRQLLEGRVTVFAGPSGVGKSSLLNALAPDFQLATGDISDKIRRGKHTTRSACLLPLGSDDSIVVDTPGFSAAEAELEQMEKVDKMEKSSLAWFFPEFRKYIPDCYFNTCTHSHEPNCAVKRAVDQGDISGERYEAYINIFNAISAGKR